MYSSPSLSKRSLFVTSQLLFICKVSSLNLTNTYLHHKCFPNQGEYKPGSEFDRRLTHIIKSFTKNVDRLAYGYNHVSIAKPPNTVSVMLQCRGDSYGSMCLSCFKAASSDMLKRCPRNKGRIIWYDQCFIDTTVSLNDDREKMKIHYENNFLLHNPNKISGDPKLFNKETITLLQNLTVKANDEENKGKNGEVALYAAGEKRFGTKTLYAMVQCIRDDFVMHEMKLCKKCLDTIINNEFSKCCDGKQGGRIMGTSCTFRYEIYPFLRT